MAKPQVVRVRSRDELRSQISVYAGKGFSKIHDDDTVVTLSRKKPFNWVLAIICLCIPIIGWIALVFMLMASGRGGEVVELHLLAA